MSLSEPPIHESELEDAPTPSVTALERLAQRPGSFQFYWAMRLLEAERPDLPRIGTAKRPSEESVRYGQEPSLGFKGASIERFSPSAADAPGRLDVNFFGILGPEGPMPTSFTRHVLEQGEKNPALRVFVNIFNHRLIELLYRGWAESQPVCQADRPDADRFATTLADLAGIPTAGRSADGPPVELELHHAGLMLSSHRTARGLERVLSHYLETDVTLTPWTGRWMTLRPEYQARLGRVDCVLGRSALGRRAWDAATNFRLTLGPMDFSQYEALLPDGHSLRRVAAIVRRWTEGVFGWRLRLRLRADQVPSVVLGQKTRLGWTSWLPVRPEVARTAECDLDPEMLLAFAQSAR